MTREPFISSVDPLAGSALDTDLSFLLARANALALAAGNAALERHGLRVRSYSVLALAATRGAPPAQRDLADFLRLDPSQVVALVDGLEKDGLVERHPDPTDRRAKVVIATGRGREIFAAAQVTARKAERASHSGLSDREHEVLSELLRRLAFRPDAEGS